MVVALLSVYSNHEALLIVHRNPGLTYTGLLLAGFGMYFFIRAKQDLGENYSPCYDAYLLHNIAQKGIYQRIRHPIYTTNIVTLFALLVASGSLWILFNVVALVYFYNKSAVNEETELASRYADYGDYMKRTNRYFPSPKNWFQSAGI